VLLDQLDQRACKVSKDRQVLLEQQVRQVRKVQREFKDRKEHKGALV
jgi:hypothetical protein